MCAGLYLCDDRRKLCSAHALVAVWVIQLRPATALHIHQVVRSFLTSVHGLIHSHSWQTTDDIPIACPSHFHLALCAGGLHWSAGGRRRCDNRQVESCFTSTNQLCSLRQGISNRQRTMQNRSGEVWKVVRASVKIVIQVSAFAAVDSDLTKGS